MTNDTQISVYIGDIHGARLAPQKRALGELDVEPSRLLCTSASELCKPSKLGGLGPSNALSPS